MRLCEWVQLERRRWCSQRQVPKRRVWQVKSSLLIEFGSLRDQGVAVNTRSIACNEGMHGRGRWRTNIFCVAWRLEHIYAIKVPSEKDEIYHHSKLKRIIEGLLT